MILFIVTLAVGLLLLYLNFKIWNTKERTRESAIPFITAFGSLILVSLSFLKERDDRKMDLKEKNALKDSLFIQNRKLENTVRLSTVQLQDTLQKQISHLQFEKDSLERKIIRISPDNLILEEKIILDTTINVNSLTRTGITYRKNDKVTISASGSMTLGSIAGQSEPNGVEKAFINFTRYNIIKEYKHGCLMYKSTSSDWIYAGFEKKFIAKNAGDLVFEINDTQKSDNSGKYIVKVIISR